MSASVLALKTLLEQRFPDAVPIAHKTNNPVATGIAQLDRALPGGGFPLGRLTVWEPGGGATSIMRAACRATIANGDRAAWIDVAGTVAGAFWDEGPLLVRPQGRVHALRAVDELLRSGGFRLVVLAGQSRAESEKNILRDVDLVRLVRSAHDGGGAFVALTQLSTMAALRIAARIAPDQYRWRRDPFGDPAEVQEVRIRMQVRALGWNARAEFPIPVQSHELRLSLEPRLADRRGLKKLQPELAAVLLTCAPHVAIGERGTLWVDARGLDTFKQIALAADALVLLGNRGIGGTHAAVANTPIVAELAARAGRGNTGDGPVAIVASGTDRAFVALFPIAVLEVPPRLEPLLFAIGVTTCGELAVLEHEAVEVRLGPEGVALWRLARADDRRSEAFFPPLQRELPHASLDWVEYALKDPLRLIFVANSLIESVCNALIENGSGAREIALEFSLTDRTMCSQPLIAARPTANRRTWIRLARTALERLTLSAAVTGIAARAVRVTGQEAKQGDLFDRGFGSARATEEAVAKLVEDQGDIVLVPKNSAHPLIDKRTEWEANTDPVHAHRAVRERVVEIAKEKQNAPPHLLLQLTPSPQAITVETTPRRDHFVPARYRDTSGWHEIVQVAGPDRVSGGQCEGKESLRTYAREYFRCVTRDGVLVWIFRDAQGSGKSGNWYLHGWWD